MAFESSLSLGLGPGPVLTGDITRCDITEVDGVAPGNIIRTDQNWEASLDWHIAGPLLVSPFFSFVGRWVVRIYLESMGPGTEYTLPALAGSPLDVSIFSAVAPDQRDYTHTVNIPGGTVDAGTYKVVIALTYESAPGVPGPITGFCELGLVQFYTP